MAAVTFAKDTITAWFNNEAYHSAPLTLNLVHNAAIRALLGEDHSIRVINKPLPFSANTTSPFDFTKDKSFIAVKLTISIGLAMVFVAAFYVIFYIKVSVF